MACKSYLCFSPLKFSPAPASDCVQYFLFLFCFQQFNYDMSGCVYFFKTLLGDLWDSWICCCLSFILENSPLYLFRCFSFPVLALFSSGTRITHTIDELWLYSYVVSELIHPLFGFVYFFLLCFSLGNHYWHIFKSLILSLVVSNLLISRLKKFFISDTVFLLLAFLFDFLNIISPLWRNYFYTYCLYVFFYVLYYMLFIFFISSLNSYFKLRLIILIFVSFFILILLIALSLD